MRIHIMGASCAGSTTLGKRLSVLLNTPYFDTDDYFWEEAAIPYTVKRNPVLRNQMLKDDIAKNPQYIIGGSLVSWGNEWKQLFDVIVFLYVPQDIRIQRLKQRELERYGDEIFTNPQRALLFKEFIEWACSYDNRLFTGRNVQIHENWLNEAEAKTLEIRGNTTVDERLKLVLEQL